MKNLRQRVFRNFIVISVALFLVAENTDWAYDVFLVPHVQTSSHYTLLVSSRIILDILYLALASYLFWVWTKKAFKEVEKNLLEAQNLLYASIVHDIKTPMTSIKGYAGALLDGKVEDETKALKVINEKSKVVSEMLDDLFDYTKLAAGSEQDDQTRFDLAELSRVELAEVYDIVEEREVEMYVDIPDESCFVQGSSRQLARLLNNLYVNALKHNPKGTRVNVSLKEEGTYYRLAVADNGVEIPRGSQNQLFEPFVQADIARSGSGSGLGLAIAKNIALKHQADLFIEDGIAGYTKAFVLHIPKV